MGRSLRQLGKSKAYHFEFRSKLISNETRFMLTSFIVIVTTQITPIEETLNALVDIVKQGKALYIGISRWPLEQLKQAYNYLAEA